MKTTQKAFTLIELLIVVAIIAILAAIAVPNFLQAQVRAKVSRTVSDMKTIGMAIRVYAVDNNAPPYFDHPPWFALGVSGQHIPPSGGWKVHYGLTTPIAYLTTVPPDYFNSQNAHYWNPAGRDEQLSVIVTTYAPSMPDYNNQFMWFLESVGPDLIFWNQEPGWQIRQKRYEYFYNPTNGAISSGQIWYYGDGLPAHYPTISVEY